MLDTIHPPFMFRKLIFRSIDTQDTSLCVTPIVHVVRYVIYPTNTSSFWNYHIMVVTICNLYYDYFVLSSVVNYIIIRIMCYVLGHRMLRIIFEKNWNICPRISSWNTSQLNYLAIINLFCFYQPFRVHDHDDKAAYIKPQWLKMLYPRSFLVNVSV